MGVQLYGENAAGQCLHPGPNSPSSPASARSHSLQEHRQRSHSGELSSSESTFSGSERSVSPNFSPGLPFSIENILRPDFGRVLPIKTLPPSPFDRVPPLPLFHHHLSLFPRHNHAQQRLLRSPSAVSADDSPPVDLSRGHADQISRKQPADTTTDDHGASSSQQQREHQSSADPEKLANPPLPADDKMVWPAWVYCTRYSDRPSSGPRSRRVNRIRKPDEKRPRTAFSNEQLQQLAVEFSDNRYLSEERRRRLSRQLGLNESQIKIWFQNKRAKLKKTAGDKPTLAKKLMEQGLYNHSTILPEEEERLMKMCQQTVSSLSS